jgi:methylmalonyl-CoA/ethylmalonyl-CoA epimerase
MKLHHIGFVVNDISKYEQLFMFEKKVKEIFDPIQNSQMALYTNFSNSFIELIQPINENSLTYNFLHKNGNCYHHLCYEVYSYDDMNRIVRDQKLILVKGPLPAILFDNREVWFYYSRGKQILEFLI